MKDRLWFFVSNNFNRTLDNAAQESIGWLTIPPGERRLNTNNIFGKITYTPHVNHTVSFSGIWDTFISQNGGIGVPETYTKNDYTQTSFRLNYRGILSQNTLLTAALGQSRVESNNSPLDEDMGPPRHFWLDVIQDTNNAQGKFLDSDKRLDLTAGITHFLDTAGLGQHELGGGLFYKKGTNKGTKNWTGSDSDPWVGNGFDNGLFITWASPGIPFGLSEYAESEFNNASEGYGFYIQDRFTIERFSLMLGLRSETQTLYDDLGQELWSWGLGDFLAPRVSIAVDLLRDGRNILKFSYGTFFRTMTNQTLSFFNSRMGVSARLYDWAGSEDPSDAQLRDPSNWELVSEQSAASNPYHLDPDLKPNKSHRFLLGFERQLTRNWAVKISGIYSYSRNLLDTIALYDPDAQLYSRYVFTNFEFKRRDYKAIEIELNGRIANRFLFNASYTWSQDKGTNPGQRERYTWDGTWGGTHDITVFGWHTKLPDDHPAKEFIDNLFGGLGGIEYGDEGWYGFLPYGVNHQVKILGTYFAPYGIAISTGIDYLSGYHWEQKGLTASGFYLKYVEGRGVRTTPSHVYMDVLVQKDFRLHRGLLIGVGLNVYNLLNSQRPVSYIKEDTDLFGEVWGRQLPRWLQLKLSLRF